MPPTFLYLVAFGAWLCLAFLVWCAAAGLLIFPTMRRLSGPLASAMAFTFPTVIAYQLAALPLMATILGVGLLVMRLIDPSNIAVTSNPAVIGIALSLIVAELAVFGGMSLVGFFDGWRTGWWVARGRSLRTAIAQSLAARLLNVLKRR